MIISRPGFAPQYVDEPAPIPEPGPGRGPTIEEAMAAAKAREDAALLQIGAQKSAPMPTEEELKALEAQLAAGEEGLIPSSEAQKLLDAIEQGKIAAGSSPSIPAEKPELIPNLNPSPPVVERPIPTAVLDPNRVPQSLTNRDRLTPAEETRVAAAIELSNQQTQSQEAVKTDEAIQTAQQLLDGLENKVEEVVEKVATEPLVETGQPDPLTT